MIERDRPTSEPPTMSTEIQSELDCENTWYLFIEVVVHIVTSNLELSGALLVSIVVPCGSSADIV